MTHRFTRTEILIGKDGLENLRNKRVTIFGVGGVGSYVAEAIGRAGVGHITLVDFDDICITNVNRQIHALSSTVGQAKVDVMADRLREINPDVDIVAIKGFFLESNAKELLTPKPDYVFDAIDHFTAKAALITICREKGIPVISSMGAAAKLDPTQIKVSDISETCNCRMARSMRKILKQRGITSGVQVVYSTEEFNATAFIEPSDEERAANIGGLQKRVILGSISFIPSIFGLTMAGVVVNELLSQK